MTPYQARKEFLPFSPPLIGEREVAAVAEVLLNGWLSSGPKTKEFEEKFKAYVGAEAALALNSCTAGLHLAVLLNGVGEGDEVITTPLTFCATANVVEHAGGKIQLADIDPETLLIDPREIEKRISPKTKALLPVHYAGLPCDMDAINAIARAKNLKVIEDAAHCLPSKIGSKFVGSSENLTVFSFYATKNITTGEGGMITGPTAMIDQARMLALHGMSRNAWDRFAKGGTWKYDVPAPGYKYNLTDIASALGVVQLERIDELYERRLKVMRFYEEAFAGNRFLLPLKTRVGVQSSYHLYVIQLNLEMLSIDRDRFMSELSERNIGTSVHYAPIHTYSYYAGKYGWTPESFPKAYRAFTRMLSLPLNSKMDMRDAADVVAAVEDICAKFKR